MWSISSLPVRPAPPVPAAHRREPAVPLVVAHRGASHAAPENTLSAVRAAVSLGADLVEVDVQRTRDGALVVVHDTTLARTTDAATVHPALRPWRVGELNLQQVRLLDAGSWKSPRHAGEQVPTLAETLDVVRGTGTGLLVEVKHPHEYPGITRDLATELRVADRDGVVVQSFDHGAMLELKQRAPYLRVGLLGTPPRRRLFQLATWADQVNPRIRGLSWRYVDAVHDAGMSCHVWTVDEPTLMDRAARMGVDGIITNRPRLLARRLGRAPTRRATPAAA